MIFLTYFNCMKKIYIFLSLTPVLFIASLFLSAAQEGWTSVGRAELVQSPNPYIYYELFYYDFDTSARHDFSSLLADGKVGIGTPKPDAPSTVKGDRSMPKK